MKHWKWLLLGGVVALALAPLWVAAATNPDALTGLQEGLTATRLLVQDFYCAAGVAAFCP